MREQRQSWHLGMDAQQVTGLMAAIRLEALRCIPPAKVAETVCLRLDDTRPRADREQQRLLADAVSLASDLAPFAPSASGTTAIDRLSRQRRPADAGEAVAMDGLRAARLRLTRI